MNRTWDQRAADDDLASYPHRVEMRGTPRSLTWPDVCANCGTVAAERICVQRAFYRRRRRGRYPGFFGYRVVAADVPFCRTCAARHRDAVPQASWFRRYRWFVLNPAHLATVGFAILLWMLLSDRREALLSTSSTVRGWLIGVAAFGILWTIAITWWMSRPDRFEPPSEVTAACSISRDVGQFYERSRHVYGFRNQGFADAFTRANPGRQWTEGDQARMWNTSLVAAVLLLGGLGTARLLLWYFGGR